MTGAEATLIGAIVGGGTAVLAAAVATTGTYRVTKRSIDADATQKREERMQQRIEQAYTEILTYLSNFIAHVDLCMTHSADNLDSEIPAAPSLEPSRRAAAQLHSSALVREGWAGFESKITSFGGYVLLYRSHKKDTIAGLPDAVKEKRAARAGMEETASDLRNIANLLFDQMHCELSQAAPKPPPPEGAELP